MSIKDTFICAFLVALLSLPLHADEVSLKDGSHLVGSIQKMTPAKLIIDTAFSKGLEIDQAMVSGISSDEKVTVELASGDRVKGKLEYSTDAGQKITDTLFGDITLPQETPIAGVWRSGMSPERLEKEQEHVVELEQVKQDNKEQLARVEKTYTEKLNKLQEENTKLSDPWTGNIALGLSGEQGNSDTMKVSGRGEALRDTGFDRLSLYVEGRLEEQNQLTTTNEVFTGASLEHDIDERWFVFGSADFEKDEFESLELRAVVKTGIGRFFVRRPEFYFKGLLGLGYQHEDFTGGATFQEGIMSLGYDFKYNMTDFWKIGHQLTMFPSFSDPSKDYRLSSYFFTEAPILKADAPWKLRFSLRSDYDNLPRPGIKELDNSYNVNIVYDFK